MKFDIEHNDFWWEAWGKRPPALSEACAIAQAKVEGTPRLIPVYGHRYLPAEPASSGNPVFSVHQTDIIVYGRDLRTYLACDFGPVDWSEAVRGNLRRIRFWSDLVDANG